VPIVEVDAHIKFVHQVFRGRANLEPRSQIGFITTNYDTLLEDAIAMEHRVALDGFSGGAIAFWNGESIDPSATAAMQAHRVLKLHGSVDWFNEPQLGLLRARYGVKYLSDLASTLIYPQATKYLETQKDPFARIFDCFRRTLRSPEHHLLGIVGYSFGDDHINSEIEAALTAKGSATVVVAFSKEANVGGALELCSTLKRWLNDPSFSSRIYVASDTALYHGAERFAPAGGASLKWWTFGGLTAFLENGVTA
ncbi:MAG: SIR2 family protein, partial [Variovorax sp.]